MKNTLKKVIAATASVAMFAAYGASAVTLLSLANSASAEETASQTSVLPVYTAKNGVQAGPSSTTVVTGGVGRDGSGNIIPNGTRGSTSTTSYGATVTIPFSAFGKK